ncbi:MAG: ATPase domain-containing protein, partial [Gammaproteobacteria bacterium]
TLRGTFVDAASRRGERTLFVSFDSDGPEMIRNLSSVGLRLTRYIRNGTLRIMSARAISGSADTYLGRIKALVREHRARCLVIDPVSSWSKASDEMGAHNVAEQLIDWSKEEGITVVLTRFVDEKFSQTEGASALQFSTLADTWIHLSYLVQGGERNRGLSIIKSRGTAHSNQVRELIMSDTGVTLADTYTASGEVLMGTLRWQRENAERVANESATLADKLQKIRLDTDESELEAQLRSLQLALDAKRAERALATSSSHVREDHVSRRRARTRELRGADRTKPGRK